MTKKLATYLFLKLFIRDLTKYEQWHRNLVPEASNYQMRWVLRELQNKGMLGVFPSDPPLTDQHTDRVNGDGWKGLSAPSAAVAKRHSYRPRRFNSLYGYWMRPSRHLCGRRESARKRKMGPTRERRDERPNHPGDSWLGQS